MVKAVFDWLVAGAPGAQTAADVVQRVGDELAAAVPTLERIVVFVQTLHPQVVGRWFAWQRGGAVRLGEFSAEQLKSPAFIDSPVAEVIQTGAELRPSLRPGTTAYALIEELAADGFTDYAAFPLAFLSGERHFTSFATKAPGGFESADIAAFRQILSPFARVAEILALRRTAINLLSTYVGRNAGDRILTGRIQRGYFETLRAIIWFSDLRGFTEMSAQMEAGTIIEILNDVFDCQVPPIERRGGEILKFMGDGMLAVFPFSTDDELADLSSAALDAADDAFAALAACNERSQRQLRIGLALHVGEVAYGNIGGPSRLDFTVIGQAVNVASRLEGLTSKLGRPVLLSEELAHHVKRPLVDAGTFELKGLSGHRRVFATAARTTLHPGPASTD